MTIDPGLFNVILSVLGTAILAGITAMLRTQAHQTQLLNDFISKLTGIDSRVSGLEADMSRVWGIYDAYKVSRLPHHDDTPH